MLNVYSFENIAECGFSLNIQMCIFTFTFTFAAFNIEIKFVKIYSYDKLSVNGAL